MPGKTEIENLELNLLLEAVYKCYGYDFRNYAKASLLRRVRTFRESKNLDTISDLIPRVIHDRDFFLEMVHKFSITVTEMFRDPTFYRNLVLKVFPFLETYPYIRIWHAGCATGEEVYSTAILLKEAGIYNKTTIFATDFNDSALEIAKKGIYPIQNMKQCTQAYQASGGSESFSTYYTSGYDSITIAKDLRRNITFANHNLALDGSFGEMHLIFCRNVLIYFNRELQDRVLELFTDSLIPRGFLCLGNKESMNFSSVSERFEEIERKERIFRKKYDGE